MTSIDAAPALEYVDCTCCGSEEHVEIARACSWGVRRCARCGLRFVSPRPPTEMTASIYDEHYFDGTSLYGNRSEAGGYQSNASGYSARAVQLVRWFRSLTNVSSGRWLDVGCGPGYLVLAANRSGFSGIGIDISVTAVDYGRDVLGLDLHQAQAEELTEKVRPPLTVVSMIDALFHLREPGAVISQVYSLLGPSGYFFAGPFDLEPSSERCPGRDEQLDVRSWGIPEHLSFVNQRSMTYLLQDLGFEELRFLPMPLTPSDVASRLRFLPPRIAQPLRKALRRLPSVQSAAHALASRAVNPNAGYVLARKPSPEKKR